MKLFEMKDHNLCVTDEAWGLLPFKAILKRDKTRGKENAFKEMLFVYYYADVRSDYVSITNDADRIIELIKDIGLDSKWKLDEVMVSAIAFYIEKSETVISKLYKDSLVSIAEMSLYLRSTGTLLAERTQNGGTVTTLPMIVASNKSLPEIMRNLKAAYKEVLAEQKELEGRTKGSKTMGLFEDGLKI
jgi:hypothetical protein